jgi:hypothetical protein
MLVASLVRCDSLPSGSAITSDELIRRTTDETGELAMSDNTAGNRNAPDRWPQTTPPEGQSRRDLLKAAVVGSAAVAAAAGAGSAALALTGQRSLNPLNQIEWILPGSPGDPCAVCTTDTNENNFSTKNTFNGSESMFLWLRFLNVPGGTYTVDVSPIIQPKSANSCPTSTPFKYQSANAAVRRWVLPHKNYDCHPRSMSEVPGGTNSDSLPVSFTFTGTSTLLVQVHLDYCAATNQTYTVTTYLKQGNTVIQSCTHDITIAK